MQVKEKLKKVVIAIAISFLFTTIVNAQNDSSSCEKSLKQYQSFFKLWKENKANEDAIAKAIAPWRYVFVNCPQSSVNIYIDGQQIINYLMLKEINASQKQRYVDTLMMLYEMRIKYFGKEGYVLGRKALDIMMYRPDSLNATYNAFTRSVDLQGVETEAIVAYYYFKSAIDLLKTGNTNEDSVFRVYNKIFSIIEPHMLKGADTASYGPALRNIELLAQAYLSCDKLSLIYKTRVESAGKDINKLQRLIDMLDERGCTSSEAYYMALNKLYIINPTSDVALRLARIEITRKDYTMATNRFKEAIDKEVSSDKKAKYYLEMADMLYRKVGDNKLAKEYALQSISILPTMGSAYILIGDIIAMTRNCDNNEFTNKAIYWLAVDYFQKAKSLDPTVAAEANKRIIIYISHFPNQEEAYKAGVKQGTDVLIPCFGEKTKARF